MGGLFNTRMLCQFTHGFELNNRIKFRIDSRHQMKVTGWIALSTRRVLYLSTVFPYLSPSGDLLGGPFVRVDSEGKTISCKLYCVNGRDLTLRLCFVENESVFICILIETQEGF